MIALNNSTEMLANPLSPSMNFLLNETEESEEDDILMQHMDIRAPLSTLR